MIISSNSLSRGSGMPIQVNGALLRAPCPGPSCPACEPNTGSDHPNLPAKAARVEASRHCYAIKWVLGVFASHCNEMNTVAIANFFSANYGARKKLPMFIARVVVVSWQQLKKAVT